MSGGSSENEVYYGAQDASSDTTESNALAFVIEQMMNKRLHATIVKIQKVTNTPGQLAAVGRVDVLPLVNQVDGRGRPTPHSTVYSLSYFRAQGGRNAIICDPEVGDIGIAVICDRDISSVKANLAESNPGSGRRGNLADGVYFGVCLSGEAPDQYVRFTDDSVEIKDKTGNKIIMSSNGIDFNP